MERFTGLIPPVITPVTDGAVDPAGIAALVEHTVDNLDGYVVVGSCGEGPSLGREERDITVSAYLDAVAGRVPVIVGVAGTSLPDIEQSIGEGDRAGVSGYLVPPPFYFSNSPTGVRTFFRQVAGMTDREIMIYDNPKTTKTHLSTDLLAALVDGSPNINHVKLTDPDIDKVDMLGKNCDAVLLAGSDEVMHHQLVRGCEGAVTAAPQVFPRLCRVWFDATQKGESGGKSLYDRMLPFVIELLLGPDQYPAVIKRALFHLGVISSDEVLTPLTPLSSERCREIDAVMRDHDFDLHEPVGS
jgi:4-hydroxy-tetrahydrodipicolinate synthase